ncbi:MAG TPA: hypothetical protein VHO06_24890 [Polyangia bacterium]|nr:hypothetical protein [Polyangia bacterium]
MLKLYARLAGKSIRLALRGWPAAVVLPVYATVLLKAAGLVAPLGMVGGFLLPIVAAFLISSYLHLIWLAVSERRIGLGDLRDSFMAHFWDVISVMFATWIIQLLVGFVTRDAGDRGQIIGVLVDLTMVVFFNPVPELIYLGQGRVRSFGLLMEAGRFISAHWPEWLGPSALMGAVVLAPSGITQHGPLAVKLLMFQQLFSLDGLTSAVLRFPLWLAPPLLLFITWGMIFRGLLYDELVSRVRRPRSWP